MTLKVLRPYDFNRNEIQNAVAQVLGAAPSSPVPGQFYYDSAIGRFVFRGASAWIDSTARANHSGTQLASTISDFDTAVRGNRLDQMAVPTASVPMGNQRITSMADGIATTDAATVGQMQAALNAAANVSVIKGAVRAVVETNVNIAAPGTTLDGLIAASGQIFLLAGQTTGAQNGPYVFNGSAVPMTRATNWDNAGEAVLGSYWIVQEGTRADRFAILANDTFTFGTTTATLAFTAAGTALIAGTGIAVAGTTISIDTAVVARKVATTLSVSAQSIAVTHNLNNPDVTVQVYELSTGDTVDCDVTRSGANIVTLGFAPVAPAANTLRVVVQG